MNRVYEYYIGKPCKMDIGADGHIRWAVGRITGPTPDSIENKVPFSHPSMVFWTTPHGSTFETGFLHLYELDKNDKIKLAEFELQAKKEKVWYGDRLVKTPYNTMKNI